MNRSKELLNLAAKYIETYWDHGEIDYDGTTCDGGCLAEDCRNHAASLPDRPVRFDASDLVEVENLIKSALNTLIDEKPGARPTVADLATMVGHLNTLAKQAAESHMLPVTPL